jgi:hypothetical protein
MRLPNKEELNLLYLNRLTIGGFSSAYWSSTEDDDGDGGDADGVWYQSFSTGEQYLTSDKGGTYRVRCVRNVN